MFDTAVFVDAFQTLILGYFTAINTFYLAFSIIAFFSLVSYLRRTWRGDLEALLSETSYRPISVLVPAYNERETISDNIRSLLALSYPEFEMIVVNDGSTDDTLDVLHRDFDLMPVPSSIRVKLQTKRVKAVYRSIEYPNLLVIDKENGGKSDALNAAINAANFPLFCSIDADSLLESDALLRVARVFAEDESVVAVGGIVRVLNGAVVEHGKVTEPKLPRRFIVICQALEYLRGFLAGRTALGDLRSLLILSGAFSIFRKDRVIAAGGYSSATVCEDMEIVVRLHRTGAEAGLPTRIVFVPDPVCWTQVPEDWKSLLVQRDRWQRGLLETLWIHKRMMLNPRYGAVGMFGFPFYVIFEAFGPLIEFAGYFVVALLWAMGRLNGSFALLFLVLAILYGILISLTALILDDLLFRRYESRADLGRLILGAVGEFLGFRQLLALRRTLSFLTVFSRSDYWGSPDRKAIVQQPTPKRPAAAA
jgi:cellulose synthase/poly-beta-1,6-N-acetylglucosamine synthase-like glycosyltransferase